MSWRGRSKLERFEMAATFIMDVILYIPRLIMKLF